MSCIGYEICAFTEMQGLRKLKDELDREGNKMLTDWQTEAITWQEMQDKYDSLLELGLSEVESIMEEGSLVVVGHWLPHNAGIVAIQAEDGGLVWADGEEVR